MGCDLYFDFYDKITFCLGLGDFIWIFSLVAKYRSAWAISGFAVFAVLVTYIFFVLGVNVLYSDNAFISTLSKFKCIISGCLLNTQFLWFGRAQIIVILKIFYFIFIFNLLGHHPAIKGKCRGFCIEVDTVILFLRPLFLSVVLIKAFKWDFDIFQGILKLYFPTIH